MIVIENKCVERRTINYLGAEVTVSRDGKTVVWNNKKRSIYYNKDGYSVCAIKIPQKGWRSISVARLVATAFIPNPNNLPEVNHKDYDRTNANADNLEWITHIDNVRYSICNKPDVHGKKNPNYGNNKLSEKYRNDKAYALEKQSRPKGQNGRAKKLEVYCDGKLVKKLDYIGQGSEFFKEQYGINVGENGFRSRVYECTRKNKPYYKRFTFKYA